VLLLVKAPPPREPQPRIIEPYLEFMASTLTVYPTLRSTRLYDMIRERGYAGSPRTVRRETSRLRPTRRSEVFLRTEVLVGQQAQVDWHSSAACPSPEASGRCGSS
jgi:transposase